MCDCVKDIINNSVFLKNISENVKDRVNKRFWNLYKSDSGMFYIETEFKIFELSKTGLVRKIINKEELNNLVTCFDKYLII